MAKNIKIPVPKGSTKKGIKTFLATELEKHLTSDMINSLRGIAVQFQGETDKTKPKPKPKPKPAPKPPRLG